MLLPPSVPKILFSVKLIDKLHAIASYFYFNSCTLKLIKLLHSILPYMSNANTTTKRNPLFDRQKHPFHILGPSPYPNLVGLFLFC